MSDWFFKQGGRDKLINWIGIDSKIDSTLADAWARIKDGWNICSSFFARFRLSGWKRLLNEAVSESLTISAAGLVIMYALAIPALQEFDEERFLTGKYSVKFLDRAGNEIGQRGILHNDAVPLDEIPDAVIKATLATEDRRFFEHFGIDFLGTFRALIQNLRANGVVQGGSTLTQQLAKNLFLSSERSLQRKIKEAFLAFLLESRYSKRQILKLYLDRAYMGGGAFGVEAASQFYFGKTVRKVNLAEAALLAGLFKAPTNYAPHVNLPASRARTNEVLSNLVEAGFYSPAEVHQARLTPAKTIEMNTIESPDWFLDWAFEEVARLGKGKSEYVLTARTTIDLNLQKIAENTLTSIVRRAGRAKGARSAAMVTLETDGAIRAIVGGMDYGRSQFNRATHAKRQPGSSFKPYVYAMALENGYRPNSTVRDRSPACNRWRPKNYNGSYGGGGRVSLSRALAKSLNTVAVSLSLSFREGKGKDRKDGRDKTLDLLKRLGVSGARKSCSMALGDGGMTPLEHTGGFATFANGGKLALPYAILELVNSRGELIYSRERDEPPAPQIVPRRVARGLNQMLHQVVEAGTGGRAKLDFTHVVGKTGTSSSYRDAWFMGFTGRYVTGVWFGNDNFRPTRGVTGGSLPAQAWHNFNKLAHTDMNIKTIPGLKEHPVQTEARLRHEQLLALNPEPTQQLAKKTTSLLPDRTRSVLKSLIKTMRTAAGLKPTPEADANDTPDGKSSTKKPDQRANTTDVRSARELARGGVRANNTNASTTSSIER
ncbi:MAG: transglycosylase domain-containing protein [Hyphomicrobiaceae bacterium]